MTENMNPEDQEVKEDDGVISLDDLDSLLADEDPDFSQEMKKISEDEELRHANVELSEFEEPDEKSEESSKLNFLKTNSKLNKFINPFIEFKKKTANYFSAQAIKIKNSCVNTFFWFKNEFPGFAKTKWKQLNSLSKSVFGYLKKQSDKYNALPKKKKTGIYSTIFFTILVGAIVYVSFKMSWIPSFNEPLYTSLELVADKVEVLPEKAEFKYLYRAFPQPEHIVQLDKLVVNLKRENIHSTPMAAIEFFVELDSKETAIEIKDREKQVLDVVQRAVEEFTYRELTSHAGVIKMKSQVRSVINDVLNQGRVNKVYQKTMILKP
ncbi:MAG: flagellar basal body-associated FliL family protein [Bdellovibrionaceae bacterium]|nr:flagellar basal body-associated FliL family protein [Pseudobdellovibrionaceae bacterium]